MGGGVVAGWSRSGSGVEWEWEWNTMRVGMEYYESGNGILWEWEWNTIRVGMEWRGSGWEWSGMEVGAESLSLTPCQAMLTLCSERGAVAVRVGGGGLPVAAARVERLAVAGDCLCRHVD